MLGVVLFVEDLESRVYNGVARLVGRVQVAEPVAAFQAVADSNVFCVLRVVFRCEDPFGQAERGAGLEDAGDFGVGAQEGGRVDCGFDRVGGIEAGRGKGEVLSRNRVLVRLSYCWLSHAFRKER